MEIGLFPLGIVLLPTEQVPLHIFEPRYRELIAECIEGEQPFGLVYADDDGLRRTGTLARVVEAIRQGNDDVGGRLVELAGAEYMIRGRGYARSIEDLEKIVVAVDPRGVPVLIRDIARVVIGPEIRRGVVDLDGIGDTAGGIVVMRHGENALNVIERVKHKIREVEPSLPEGVEIVPTYDRSDLIHRAIDTLMLKAARPALHAETRGGAPMAAREHKSAFDAYIRGGIARRVLVIGAETFSRILDWTDRTTCVLFGDGAGAIVLEAQEGEGTVADRGVLTGQLRSDGAHLDKLYVDGGPSTTGTVGHLRMEGREVFKHAVGMITDVIVAAFDATGLAIDDLDWLVPHQANRRIIDGSAKKLGIPLEKVVVTVDLHGNTSAASIPLALASAAADGRIKKGDLVLLEAMGGGFTWGAVLLRW